MKKVETTLVGFKSGGKQSASVCWEKWQVTELQVLMSTAWRFRARNDVISTSSGICEEIFAFDPATPLSLQAQAKLCENCNLDIILLTPCE